MDYRHLKRVHKVFISSQNYVRDETQLNLIVINIIVTEIVAQRAK